MHKFDFTLSEYNYFLKECPFTDLEKEILGLRRKEKSITEISMKLNISKSTVDRRIKSIINKIKKSILWR